MAVRGAERLASPLAIGLFGGWEVRLEGRPLPPLRSEKSRWLLALLALQGGRPVERVWLAGTLWPESGQEQAAFNLRRNLTDLRHAFGLEARRLDAPSRRTLRLDLDSAEVDVLIFDEAVARGDAASLERAVALRRGPLLEGCTEEWALLERLAREEAYLAALERLAAEARERGDLATAAQYLRKLVAADPLRESAQRALMELLAAGGEFAAATQVYRELRLLLHRELNAAPDPTTIAAYEQIRAEARRRAAAPSRFGRQTDTDATENGVRPVATTDPHGAAWGCVEEDPSFLAPAPCHRQAFPHNLPLQLTSFIGREDQITEVTQLLTGYRLVTLTGPGGCGKTRLGLQVAAGLLERFPDGVWWAELAPLADPALVPQAVATVLRVREAPGRSLTQTLIDALKARRLLLLLDNCEHLVDACAPLAEALLQSCPMLRILATSREPLGIGGETAYRVPTLSLPSAQVFRCSGVQASLSQHPTPEYLNTRIPEHLLQYEAIRLFSERAVAALPTFRVTAANAMAVARVCRRLDGIPLAIELAAARVKALPVEQIAARLDDMFRLLTRGSRTALPHHQTLRALIDWSYDLLAEGERTLLQRLSVFSGGCTMEAAEDVCADEAMEACEVLGSLTSLVEKSLVEYEAREGEGRYRLLETVRQYARDRLLEGGDAEAVRGRHAAFFLQLAERAEPEFRGSQQLFWAERLEGEHGNLRAALTWFGSAEKGAEAQLRLTSALWLFWFRRGYYLREGRQWTEEALSRGRRAPAPVRAKALLAAGALASYMGDGTAADLFLEESVALARGTGQQWVAAHSLFFWAMLAIRQGSYAQAAARAQESLTLAQKVDDPWLRARPATALGLAALHQDDPVSARSFFEENLALARSIGDRFLIARTTANLGAVALSLCECERAGVLYREALTRCQEVADQRFIAACLSGLAAVAAPTHPERAARLFGAAEALREAMGSPHLTTSDHRGYDQDVAALRAQLDEETFAAAWAEGRAMPLGQAIEYALEDHPTALAAEERCRHGA
jgi:non-specific serine/threonine protein kinase